jgi:hypothetical protein
VGSIEGNERQGFLELVRRVLKPGPQSSDGTAAADGGPGIIVPGA